MDTKQKASGGAPTNTTAPTITVGDKPIAPSPFFIGVTGGTASGKTTVCNAIMQQLDVTQSSVVLLSMDSFYRQLTDEERKNPQTQNFDHPDAFDWVTMRACLSGIARGETVHIPRYDFKTYARTKETDVVNGAAARVVLIEGILTLFDTDIRALYDMKVFVDTDADLRLARRLKRDMAERGRTAAGVLDQYLATVKPAFDEFIYPTKRHADIIVPHADYNKAAVDLLAQHIKSRLQSRTASVPCVSPLVKPN